MNIKVFYAERLIGNLRNFILAVEGDGQLTELLNLLIMMYIEAEDYLYKLEMSKGFSSAWTQKLRDMADMLMDMQKNDKTDAMYMYISHLNTVISGAYALEWDK